MAKFYAKLPVIRNSKPMYWRNTSGEKIYFGRDKKVEPHLNPLVDKLRKLLTKQKLKFEEISDGEFITFKTVEQDQCKE